jgi:hypothetical protein
MAAMTFVELVPVNSIYLPGMITFSHRVETYRDVTDRCKHCGRLRFHVPTFFQATGRKMINCACSASLKWVVIRSSSNQMHASSNLPSMRTKKVGTLVTSLYVSTLWFSHLAVKKWSLAWATREQWRQPSTPFPRHIVRQFQSPYTSSPRGLSWISARQHAGV